MNGGRLGMVVGGSLTEGVEVKLDPGASVEDVRVGSFVSIQGERMRFFGVVTDVALDATDRALRGTPPDVSNPFIARVVSGTAAYGALKVEPMLAIGGADAVLGEDGPSPAKTVPAHFSTVSAATDADIETVFGAPSERRFWIGNPMDMESKLCISSSAATASSARAAPVRPSSPACCSSASYRAAGPATSYSTCRASTAGRATARVAPRSRA